ncbi:MAG TPA: hypothetical protein PKD55_01345 [Bellilinea sp.]|nr:hypothetical protein [Bellilinea sp.]
MKRDKYSDYTEGKHYYKAAERGLDNGSVKKLREGAGDHFVVTPSNSDCDVIVGVHSNLSPGLRRRLWKLFVAAGIIVPVLIALIN